MTSAQSEDERRELAIDIMASWSLEGMEPTADMLRDIRAFVEGSLTTADILAPVTGGVPRD